MEGKERTFVKDDIEHPVKVPRTKWQRSKMLCHKKLVPTHNVRKLCRHIHRWLDACNSQHDTCSRDPARKSPEWVIDVAKHCIVSGETVNKYVALSYVWKNATDKPCRHGVVTSQLQRRMLFQSSLENFQKPGFLCDDFEFYLPRIIRETIDLVWALGLRYLWVDCLCIVQDAPDTRAKVEKMDEVYSNAYFTVIAAVSSTLAEAAQPLDEPLKSLMYYQKYTMGKSKYLYDRLQRSEWARRGWTFQEAILSRRAVVFLDGDLFWDCPCCFWDTTEPKKFFRYVLRSKLLYKHLHSYQQAKDVDIFRPNFRTWLELVCFYNQRKFTYPQDAIMAFSGVLNFLSRGFSKGFVGGTPLQSLDVALMWQPTRLAVRRKSECGSPSEYLPSWSCFGWQCRVDPESLRSGLAGLTQEDNKEHAASWTTNSLVEWSVVTTMNVRSSDGSDNTFEHCLRFSTKFAFFHLDPLVTYSAIADSCVRQAAVSSPAARRFSFRRQWPSMNNASIHSLNCLEEDDDGEECSILWLSSNGKKVGLLRQTEPDRYFDECTAGTAYARIELIAISSGSATRADLSSALEESRDCNAINERLSLRKKHEEGGAILSVNERRNFWIGESTIKDDPEWWNDTYFGSSENDSPDDIIHFINVLWIERRDGLAFRKAAGRVLKTAWEEHALGPVEIILA